MGEAQILHARQGGLAVLKFIGKIGFAQGGSRQLLASLNTFLSSVIAAGEVEDFLVDLTEATGMDSTALGLLAKTTKYTLERFNRKTVLLVTDGDMDRTLESVGFEKVFLVVHATGQCPTGLESISEVEESDKEWAVTVLAAHRELCSLNEENASTFKAVVECLQESLGEK